MPESDDLEVIGDPDGEYWSRCPTCEQEGENTHIYRTDERWRAKMEARDHREWNPDHRPIARGPGGERIYG